jgi:hypothetical protein
MITTRGRYFHQDKKRLTLAGNHTWNTVQPFNGRTTPLDSLTGNFTRLWTVETRGMLLAGSAWGSRSSGTVKVGLVPWKADGSLNKRYYRRLEAVVAEADQRDMVTGVVLFDNAFNAYFPNGWANHPFNSLGPQDASYVHTKGAWNKFQRAHVKMATKTLEDYDNVIYEVGNELHRNSVYSGFQKMAVKWVKKFTDKPVGVSYATGLYRDQSWMTRVGADWVAANVSTRAGGVRRLSGFNGPQVLDTDHGSALTPNVGMLRRGHQLGMPLWLMDGMDGYVLRNASSMTPDRSYINSIV